MPLNTREGVAHMAHRTGSAVEVSTMAARTAGEAVALHDAGEALTLGGTGDVDLLDLGESRHGLLVAGLVLGGVLDAHLAQVAGRLGALLGEMAAPWAC